MSTKTIWLFTYKSWQILFPGGKPKKNYVYMYTYIYTYIIYIIKFEIKHIYICIYMYICTYIYNVNDVYIHIYIYIVWTCVVHFTHMLFKTLALSGHDTVSPPDQRVLGVTSFAAFAQTAAEDGVFEVRQLPTVLNVGLGWGLIMVVLTVLIIKIHQKWWFNHQQTLVTNKRQKWGLNHRLGFNHQN